jgi:hypothetical protein
MQPDLDSERERILARAQFAADQYTPLVARLFGLPTILRPIVRFGYTSDGATAQSQRQGGQQVITLSPAILADPEWVSKENLSALMAHELTHSTINDAVASTEGAFQYGDPGTIMWAFEEGIADYARLKLVGKTYGFPSAGWGEFHQRPLQTGYQDMAAFLRWQENHVPGSVAAVAKNLAKGRFTTHKYEHITGLTIHDAATVYRSLTPAEKTFPAVTPTDTSVGGNTAVPKVNQYNPVHQQA